MNSFDPVARICDLIEKFQIEEPLKSWLHPAFRVEYILVQDTTMVALVCQTRDALGIRDFVNPTIHKPLPGYLLREHKGYERAALIFLQSMLHEMVKHEVDESCWIGNRQVFCPHPELRGEEVPGKRK